MSIILKILVLHLSRQYGVLVPTPLYELVEELEGRHFLRIQLSGCLEIAQQFLSKLLQRVLDAQDLAREYLSCGFR